MRTRMRTIDFMSKPAEKLSLHLMNMLYITCNREDLKAYRYVVPNYSLQLCEHSSYSNMKPYYALCMYIYAQILL